MKNLICINLDGPHHVFYTKQGKSKQNNFMLQQNVPVMMIRKHTGYHTQELMISWILVNVLPLIGGELGKIDRAEEV